MNGIRVYELAEQLGIDPDDVLVLARQQGERIKTTGGTISYETAEWLRVNDRRGSLRVRIDDPGSDRTPPPTLSATTPCGDTSLPVRRLLDGGWAVAGCGCGKLHTLNGAALPSTARLAPLPNGEPRTRAPRRATPPVTRREPSSPPRTRTARTTTPPVTRREPSSPPRTRTARTTTPPAPVRVVRPIYTTRPDPEPEPYWVRAAAEAKPHTPAPTTEPSPHRTPDPTQPTVSERRVDDPNDPSVPMSVMALALLLQVPGVWLRTRARTNGYELVDNQLDAHTVEAFRMLGAAWLTSQMSKPDEHADTTITSSATTDRLCRFLEVDPYTLRTTVRERLGVELPADAGELLPAYVVEYLLSSDRDEPTPAGIPVLWSPGALPDHLDRVAERARSSAIRSTQLAGLDLADADIVWVTRPAWECHREDPITAGAVHDVIPIPAGVVVFAQPVYLDDLADQHRVIAVSWRHDDRAYDVTVQAWHTDAFEDHTTHLAAGAKVFTGMAWRPGPRFTIGMDDDPRRESHPEVLLIEALVRQWQLLQRLPARGQTRSATTDMTVPTHPDHRPRSEHRAPAVDVTRWRTTEHPNHTTDRERRPNGTSPQEEKVWWVRGHWRWVPVGPGGLERRRVWVRQHRKGHGSLEPRRRVYILDA